MFLLAGIVEDRSRMNAFSYYSRKMLFILVVVAFFVVSSSAASIEKPALDRSVALSRSPLERFKVLAANKSQLGASQDFYTLREKCLKDGEPFKDPEFDTVYSSIFFNDLSTKEYNQIKWLRPHDIVKQPKFIVNGTSRLDVMQGGVGDCWFLSVLANVASNEVMISQNVPDDQNFEEKYCGIFHFRFWQMGYWIDVVVDDRLPVNGSKLPVNGSLQFAKFSQGNEFWVPLMEKAYAKLYGSYEALEGGLMYEAMEDLTGGLVASFDMHTELIPIPDFFKIMQMSSKKTSIIAAAILLRRNVSAIGLVNSHAYSITNVKTLEITKPKTKEIVSLLRIRNPWGQREWTGPWRDNATEWEFVSEDDKKELGLKQANDGEYWMTYQDFFDSFDLLDICMINSDKLPIAIANNSLKSNWEVSVFEGEWVQGKTAGGCKIDTLHLNPQYQITITESEIDSKLAFLFVGLMQESQRTLRNVLKRSEQYIKLGFVIYKSENSTLLGERLTAEYINEHKWFDTSVTYSTWRDVTRVFRVPPGVYTIIPCTFQPDVKGKFILRVVTTKKKST